MDNNKKIVLKKIFPYHSAWGAVIAIPCFLLWGMLYYYLFNGDFRLGFVMIFTILCFGMVILIIKSISRDVTIWFSEEYFFLKYGNKMQKKYLKKNILGFYCYDYNTKTPLLKKSLIKFEFILKDGSIIYLNDSEYRKKYDDEKADILKKLLTLAQKELHFSKLKKKNLQNIYWYSKT